jgi:hypothetical protein
MLTNFNDKIILECLFLACAMTISYKGFGILKLTFNQFRNGSMNIDVLLSYIVYYQQLSCVNNQHPSIC